MQITFEDRPIQLGNYDRWTLLHLQVTTPANVLIARTREDLERAAGLTITMAMNIVSLWWIGPLWAVGAVAGAQANIETLSGGRLTV